MIDHTASKTSIIENALLAKDTDGNFKKYTKQDLMQIANCFDLHVDTAITYFYNPKWPVHSKIWPANAKLRFKKGFYQVELV